MRSECRSASVRKTSESIEGSAGRGSTYPNMILFTANPTTLSLSHLLRPDLSKGPPPSAPPFSPSRPKPPSRRPSFLTHDAPSLLFSSRAPLLRPCHPPPSLLPTLYPAHRALLTIALTLSSSPSLFLSFSSTGTQTGKPDREALTEKGRGRGGGSERANGGAGSLRSCATRTSQPRATVVR